MIYIPIIMLAIGLLAIAGWTIPSLLDLWHAIWEVDHVVKRLIRGLFFVFILLLVLTFVGLGSLWLIQLAQIVG